MAGRSADGLEERLRALPGAGRARGGSREAGADHHPDAGVPSPLRGPVPAPGPAPGADAHGPDSRPVPGPRPGPPTPPPAEDLTSGQGRSAAGQHAGADSPAAERLRKEDPQRVGGFRLLERLGTGVMGRVFLGVSASGRPVAVKVIREEFAQGPAFRRRFAAEIATARRVQGTYTPAVVAADAEAHEPWLATTYIPGLSLAEAVRTAGPLAPAVVRGLAAGCSASEAASPATSPSSRSWTPTTTTTPPPSPSPRTGRRREAAPDGGPPRRPEQPAATRLPAAPGRQRTAR